MNQSCLCMCMLWLECEWIMYGKKRNLDSVFSFLRQFSIEFKANGNSLTKKKLADSRNWLKMKDQNDKHPLFI